MGYSLCQSFDSYIRLPAVTPLWRRVVICYELNYKPATWWCV